VPDRLELSIDPALERAVAMESALPNLSRGFFSIALRTISPIADGTERLEGIGGIGSSRCLRKISPGPEPSNGTEPVIIWNNVTPTE
jgi:hypothetical protein